LYPCLLVYIQRNLKIIPAFVKKAPKPADDEMVVAYRQDIKNSK
jgi:hypothetical protein